MKNKKFWLFFTIITNIGIVLSILISIIAIINIKIPEVITKNEFITYIQKKGCPITNKKESYNSTDIDTFLTTDLKTCPYFISYAIFNNENTLNEYFLQAENNIFNLNNNTRFQTSISIFNKYIEYSSTGDYYKTVTLNKNSVLYAHGMEIYKEDINQIFKDLHYRYTFNWSKITIASTSIIIYMFIWIISIWGIEKKTRNKGWIALIPFYNIGCLTKDILGSAWYTILFFLPFINFIMYYILLYNIGKKFEKDVAYSILLIFFPTILLPMVAFDNSKYHQKIKIKKEENVEQKEQEEKIEENNLKKDIFDIIKWVITILLFLITPLFFLVYLDEKTMDMLITGIIVLIFGLLACPTISNYTKKYKTYTKYKPFIVIIFIIIIVIIIELLEK